MHVTGIGWAGVLTEEFESTLRFFSEVLGLALAYRDETKELVHFRFRSGQLLEVHGPSNRRRRAAYQWYKGPALGFEVSDIESARQEMTARGTRFITELETWEDDRWTMFLGPEDKLFELLIPSRRPTKEFGRVLSISRTSVAVQQITDGVQFFSHILEIPLTQSNAGGEIAYYRLPAGHWLVVFGPSDKRSQLTHHTIIGFEVNTISEVRRETGAQGIEFIGPIETAKDGNAWTHFRAPDGFIYELTYPPAHRSLFV